MTADLSFPDPEEMEQAELIGRELSAFSESKDTSLVFRHGGKELSLPFPPSALHLLTRIMEQMSLGNSVTLIPVHAQLTTQEAADVLNVSRPYVVKLVEKGKLPCVKVGSHRRIRFDDLMSYKKQMLAESEKARARLAELSQEMEDDFSE